MNHTLLANTLVRMETQQGTVIKNIDLRLFETDAPLTVANFLHYANVTTVNGGNYNLSFIHRSISGFVIQGGGFTFDPLVGDGSFTAVTIDFINYTFPGGLQQIAKDPTVVNEFKHSNVRGTIAMAKKSGNPDSADSEWFISLADNSANLDNQNGGFTAFGEVLNGGMSVADEIASHPVFPRTDIHSAFGSLPLVGFTADPIQQANLVRINKVTELVKISDDIDFKTVFLNASNTQSVVSITNTGSNTHTVGQIALTDPLNLPFSIIADSCSNATLIIGGNCIFTIQFSPQAEQISSDTFNIEFTDLALSYQFSVTGEGVNSPPAPVISPTVDSVDYGEAQLKSLLKGQPANKIIFFNNTGNLNLNVSAVTLTGADAGDFQLFEQCVSDSPVAANTLCFASVSFEPLTVGAKNAQLKVISDDLAHSPLNIPLTGVGSQDADGIAILIEDKAPNSGDGNYDGIADSIQSNVVSLPGKNGVYVTLLSSVNNTIKSLTVLSDKQLVTPPSNVQFDLGVFDYKVTSVVPGSSIEIGIILPENVELKSYYMYGPTPDDINPHWYEFLFDGTTGAQLIKKARLTSPDGATAQRNFIRLIFKDGARGDADLQQNGEIIDSGGPDVITQSGASTGSSGSLNIHVLFCLVYLLVFFRYGFFHSRAVLFP